METPKCKKCGMKLCRDGSKYIWKYCCGCENEDTRLVLSEPSFLNNVEQICQVSSEKGIVINCIDKGLKEILDLEQENEKLKQRIKELEA